MTQTIQSVQRDSIRDQVVRQLNELIVSGSFKPGECLPTERELAEQFGVSRPVIREALSALISQGFLDRRQGSGSYVRPEETWNILDPAVLLSRSRNGTLLDLQEIREHLEPFAAALAAERATREDLSIVVGSLELLEGRIKHGGSVEEAVEADFSFHSAVNNASHNQVLLIMLNSVNELLREIRVEVYQNVPDSATEALNWHRHILDNLEQRDPHGVFTAMQNHIQESWDHYVATLDGRELAAGFARRYRTTLVPLNLHKGNGDDATPMD